MLLPSSAVHLTWRCVVCLPAWLLVGWPFLLCFRALVGIQYNLTCVLMLNKLHCCSSASTSYTLLRGISTVCSLALSCLIGQPTYIKLHTVLMQQSLFFQVTHYLLWDAGACLKAMHSRCGRLCQS